MQTISIALLAFLALGLQARAKTFSQEEVIRALKASGEIPEDSIAKCKKTFVLQLKSSPN